MWRVGDGVNFLMWFFSWFCCVYSSIMVFLGKKSLKVLLNFSYCSVANGNWFFSLRKSPTSLQLISLFFPAHFLWVFLSEIMYLYWNNFFSYFLLKVRVKIWEKTWIVGKFYFLSILLLDDFPRAHTNAKFRAVFFLFFRAFKGFFEFWWWGRGHWIYQVITRI